EFVDGDAVGGEPRLPVAGGELDLVLWGLRITGRHSRSPFDLLVLGAPGFEAAALVMVFEGIGLRSGQFPVQLRAPVVRLSRPAEVDLIVLLRRREDLLVVVMGSNLAQAIEGQIGER